MEAEISELIETAALELVGAVLSQQMIGDVQNMSADYESGMLAAAPNYHAALDGRQRSVTGMPGSLAAPMPTIPPGNYLISRQAKLSVRQAIGSHHDAVVF